MKRYASVSFPDFRNFGVVLRALVLAEVMRWSVLLLSVWGPDKDFWRLFSEQDALFEPVLLTVVACLAAASPWLRQWRYGLACVFSIGMTAALAALWHIVVRTVLPFVVFAPLWRSALLASLVAGAVLFYFNWRHYRLSPAWSEARLMALQARIQPHFLFNSLNSVLSLIRVDSRKAETMLEDLSDLYRHLLTDVRQLVPLSQELELARTYLHIEAIRFGERLRVNWVCQQVPDQALVPPLLLQPLLENAVRHGVEPQPQGALITIEVSGHDGLLDLRVGNPLPNAPEPGTAAVHGNHMALENLRERLELHYDAEASLVSECRDGQYQVRLRLPVR